jgi:hypothetical protein
VASLEAELGCVLVHSPQQRDGLVSMEKPCVILFAVTEFLATCSQVSLLLVIDVI